MLWIMITILAVLLLLLLLLSYWTYRMVFYWPKYRHPAPGLVPKDEQSQLYAEETAAMIAEMRGAPFEEVTITAYDGVTLFGRYYHRVDDAPIQLQMHGYHGNYLRDFCGGYKLAAEMGHNTLVIDQRSHGKSGSTTTTFGIKERRDCLSWIEYLNRRFGEDLPVFLSGVSMGAATVLMASELPLPKNVVGIIADCPYSSPGEIIRKVAAQRGYPPRLTYPFLSLGALLWGRFLLDSSAAYQAVQNTDIPILLIHGDDDRFVPCDMSRKIAANAKGSLRLEIFPNAGHGLSILTDPVRYYKVAEEFVLECCKAFAEQKNRLTVE